MPDKIDEKVTAKNYGRKLEELHDAWREMLAYRDLIDRQSSNLAEHLQMYIASSTRDRHDYMPSKVSLGKARSLTASLAVTAKNFIKKVEEIHIRISNCEDFFTE